ncbi:MAG: SusC/RagA family TonB-linked outer membrane protein [Bacteroidales bacterium]
MYSKQIKTFRKKVLQCTTILLFSCSVALNAQEIKLHYNNVPLKTVLKDLSKQSGYNFMYSSALSSTTEKISCSIDSNIANIHEILQTLFKGKKITYTIKDKQVLLAPASITPANNLPDKYKISGVVTDDTGEPVAGATIRIVGTDIYFFTKADGTYTLEASKGDRINVNSIGLKDFEFPVDGNKTTFNVTMAVDKLLLDEVVVTGYQTLSRDRVTGSFGSISAEKLNNTMTSDLISRLDGKVAGLQIKDGNLTIRGAGSILSSTSPLIVVDGFPIENGLESVNPDDIQNVTVLKDAAAASIWGTRAGNGVIVITTKKGAKSSKTAISASYQFTISNKNKISNLRLLNASDAIDLDLELIQKNFWGPDDVSWHSPVGKVQEHYYNALLESDFRYTFDDIIKDEKFNQNINALRQSEAHRQIEKYIYQNALQHRANISLSGGNEKSDYYVSGVIESNKGNAIRDLNTDFKLNLKYSYYLTKKLTLNTNASIFYSMAEQNGIDNYSIANSYSYHNLLDNNGEKIQYYMIDPWEGKRREAMGYLPYTNNMLDDIRENNKVSNNFSARLQASLNYEIIEGLNVNTKFQYERGFSKNEESQKVSHSSMRAMINAYTTISREGQLEYNFPLGGYYGVDNLSTEAWTWRNQLDYNKTFNKDHQLMVLFGHELRKYKTVSNATNQYGYDFQAQTYTPINEGLLITGEYPTWLDFAPYGFSALNRYAEVDNRDLSLYANAGYTFKQKYSASVSGRMDQSNIFGNDSKYKYNVIWSAGVSWKISDENFMKANWIDNLVLKATYGLGGNINKNFYPVLMGRKDVSSYTGLAYLFLTNPENKNLKWETSKTTNIGLDFSFLKGRINGNIDFYNKRGDDLLGRVSLDPTNGFASATMNFASVENRGFEFNLNTTPVRTKNFTFTVGGNITYNKNTVIKVDDEGGADTDFLKQVPEGIAIEGKPLNRLYAYNYAGLDENGEPLIYEKGEKVSWQNYSGNIDNLLYMGTTVAPWYGGINTSLSYKNFIFSALATYEFGHVFRRPTASPYSDSKGILEEITGRWKKPGDENHTNVPALTDYYSYDEAHEYYTKANLNVLSAAYIKLNEVSLAYNFSKNTLPKFFSNLNVSFQVRNLCQWNKNKDDIDPQYISISRYGSTSYQFKEPVTFIFALKLTL